MRNRKPTFCQMKAQALRNADEEARTLTESLEASKKNIEKLIDALGKEHDNMKVLVEKLEELKKRTSELKAMSRH